MPYNIIILKDVIISKKDKKKEMLLLSITNITIVTKIAQALSVLFENIIGQ